MDLKGYLLNCFIGGEEVIHKPNGSLVRNKIALSFAGYEIMIVQRPEVISGNPGDYKGQAVETTEVTVHNLELSNIESVIDKLRGLATLLSFITCSQVVLYGWECSGVNPSAQYWSVVGRTGFFRPVLEIMHGRIVREFLEKVWPFYFRLEQPRKLRVAIDYFVSAQVLGLPLELKLITIFVLFENLKSTFASDRGYKYKKGYYQKPLGGRWSFKELLMEMFSDVAMNPSIDSIITLRNEIIHSGISQMPYSTQTQIYENCQDVVREYFMRLLRFSGSFFLYSGRGMRAKSI